MADIGISGAAALQQPVQRQPVQAPIQQNLEVPEPTQAANTPEAEPTTVATPPPETSSSGDDGSDSSVDLNQLVARGQAQEGDAPRTQQQIDGQRQQLQDSVARAESPAPEPQIDAQA